MKKLFTIGYEGANIDDFVATLRANRVNVLLDVREMPISRRRGYSKTVLSQTMQAHDIGYRHERLLGSPKDVRHRLHEDGDYARFFRDFGRHLGKQGDLLATLAREIKGNVALMCYERNFLECHRRAVADALAGLIGSEPVHLGVENHAGKASEKARSYSRQGLSAA